MFKAVHRGFIVVSTLFFITSNTQLANAQIGPTNSATISGSLSDSNGKSVAGAQIFVRGPRVASTVTDAHGLFVFVGMPFGTYELSANASGLGTATRTLRGLLSVEFR